jgi:hypothetical protein
MSAVAQMLGYFFHGQNDASILTQNGSSYILGDKKTLLVTLD